MKYALTKMETTTSLEMRVPSQVKGQIHSGNTSRPFCIRNGKRVNISMSRIQ